MSVKKESKKKGEQILLATILYNKKKEVHEILAFHLDGDSLEVEELERIETYKNRNRALLDLRRYKGLHRIPD